MRYKGEPTLSSLLILGMGNKKNMGSEDYSEPLILSVDDVIRYQMKRKRESSPIQDKSRVKAI